MTNMGMLDKQSGDNCDVAVSVIVPVYNASEHLEECLDSIRKQSLDNFEVIIVNDASTDNSEQIARG